MRIPQLGFQVGPEMHFPHARAAVSKTFSVLTLGFEYFFFFLRGTGIELYIILLL